jgi:hypothetical protein
MADPAGDGWADAATTHQGVIKGSLLKCNDGQWLKGKGNQNLNGAQRVAVSTRDAWVHWVDQKPVQYILRKAGKQLPDRSELGDLDESLWPVGPDGKTRRDPWVFTTLVYLIDEQTAEQFTFATSTWGGRMAVAELGEQVATMRRAHGQARAVPVVELTSFHKQTRFGRKLWPQFKIVDWRGFDAPAALDEIPDGE